MDDKFAKLNKCGFESKLCIPFGSRIIGPVVTVWLKRDTCSVVWGMKTEKTTDQREKKCKTIDTDFISLRFGCFTRISWPCFTKCVLFCSDQKSLKYVLKIRLKQPTIIVKSVGKVSASDLSFASTPRPPPPPPWFIVVQN